MRAPPHVSSSDKCALSCAITRTPPAYAGPSSYLVLRQVRTFVRYHQDSSRLRGPLLISCLATSAHFRALSPGLLPLTRAPPHILSCDKCALSCAITRTPPAYAGPSSYLVLRQVRTFVRYHQDSSRLRGPLLMI